MDHVYNLPQFGNENWFSYQDLYSRFVRELSKDSKIVEVGVWKGKSVVYLAVEIINANKSIKVDAIDTWLGSKSIPSELCNNSLYETFITNISPFRHIITPIRMDSVKASSLYIDNSIDVVFIDADHEYDSVKNDIIAWYPKVKSGGYIAGHDFHNESVKSAVIETLGKIENIEYSEYEDCWIVKKTNIQPPKRKIYQISMFNNELDILELSLESSYNHIDKFVIVESTKTISGNNKDLIFLKNKKRFDKYKDKIIHLICDFESDIYDHYKNFIIDTLGKDDYTVQNEIWIREFFQRDYPVKYGDIKFNPEDILLILDIDEIPNIDSLTSFLTQNKNITTPYRMEMDFMHYYYNATIYSTKTDIDKKWYYPTVIQYSCLNRYYFSTSFLRIKCYEERYIIKNGGWHFSFLMPPEAIYEKIKSFSHAQENRFNVSIDDIKKSIKDLDIFYENGGEFKLRLYPTTSLPKTIQNNIQKYKNFMITKNNIDNNDILVVVAGHINNVEKKNYVVDLLNKLKKDGLKVCYVTHSPMYIDTLSEQVDYLYYDKNNLVINHQDYLDNCYLLDNTFMEYGLSHFYANCGSAKININGIAHHCPALTILLKNGIDIANTNHFKWIVFIEYDLVMPDCGFQKFIHDKINILIENDKKCLLYNQKNRGYIYPGILIFNPHEVLNHPIFLKNNWYSSTHEWIKTWKLGFSESITEQVLRYSFNNNILYNDLEIDVKKYWNKYNCNNLNLFCELTSTSYHQIITLLPFKKNNQTSLALYLYNSNNFAISIKNLIVFNKSQNKIIYEFKNKTMEIHTWFIDILCSSLYSNDDEIQIKYDIDDIIFREEKHSMKYIENVYNYICKLEFND